jgi:hypothetical protein
MRQLREIEPKLVRLAVGEQLGGRGADLKRLWQDARLPVALVWDVHERQVALR